jgi:NADH:ubiquinone oxidoreductase subunit H
MSILEFYTQLVPRRWLQQVFQMQIAILAVFMVAQAVSTLAMCQPIESSFDYSVLGKCRNIASFQLAISIVAVVFGLGCVLTLMPVVRKLQMSKEKKIS